MAEQLLEPVLEDVAMMHNHVKAFQKVLDEAVRVRVADIPFHRYINKKNGNTHDASRNSRVTL